MVVHSMMYTTLKYSNSLFIWDIKSFVEVNNGLLINFLRAVFKVPLKDFHALPSGRYTCLPSD